MVKRFEVWNIALDPSVGHEIKKIRPCIIVSPDESNKYLSTVIIIPLTSTVRNYPTRINCRFKGRQGQLAADQIRAVDVKRLVNKLGDLHTESCKMLCQTLEVMFRY